MFSILFSILWQPSFTPMTRVLLYAATSSSVPFLLYMAVRLSETGHFVFLSLKPLFLAILKYAPFVRVTAPRSRANELG